MQYLQALMERVFGPRRKSRAAILGTAFDRLSAADLKQIFHSPAALALRKRTEKYRYRSEPNPRSYV